MILRTVAVRYHHEGGSWWADSSDVPGFSAAGHTLDEVRGQVQEGLAFFLESDELDLREAFAGERNSSVLSGEVIAARTSSGNEVLATGRAADSGRARGLGWGLLVSFRVSRPA